jgi:hypothetical protein
MRYLPSFFLVFICLFIQTYGQTIPLTIQQVDYSKSTELQQGTYGVNNNTFSASYHIDHPSFLKAYRDLGSPTVRYPGGTVANYINLKTGKAEAWEKASSKSKLRVKNLNSSIKRNGKRYGKDELNSFIVFAKQTGIKTTFVLNISSMSLKDTDYVFNKIARSGIVLECVEMGNELYFGTYKEIVPDVASYLKLAKERTQLVKSYFPTAKIGLLLPSHVYTHESFLDEVVVASDRQMLWYNALQKEDFYDALVLHLYSSNGMGRKTKRKDFLDYKQSYRYAISHADGKFGTAIRTIEKDFPSKEVWLTEYHVGGFGGDVRSYRLRYAYLGALFTANFMMKLLETPKITIGSWHSMVQMLRYPKKIGLQLDADTPFQKTVNYHFFKAFKSPVQNASHYLKVAFNNQTNYKGLGDYTAQYSDLEAGVFIDAISRNCQLIIFNKWEKPYSVNIDNLSDNLKGLLTKITTIQPDVHLEYSKSLASETTFSKEVQDPTGTSLMLPPFSMTIVEFTRN